MTNTIITGLFTLVGVFLGLCGSIILLIYTIFKDNKDRKDKYFFALLEKRLRIYQEAYKYVELLKEAIHAPEDNRIKIIVEVREWFTNNLLFLSPSIRKYYNKAISDADSYHLYLEEWKLSKAEQERDEKKNRINK